MGLSDTLKGFADDMYETTRKAESRSKAEKVVNSENVIDKTSLNLKIERIRKIYESMTVEFWEKLYNDINDKADKYETGTAEYKKTVEEGVYIWERKELIYHSYARILREQHHADELLGKLKLDLRKLDLQYDKTLSEQLKLEV
jgi:hypothetical protein